MCTAFSELQNVKIRSASVKLKGARIYPAFTQLQGMRICRAIKRVLVLYLIRGGEFIDHCGSNQTFKNDSKPLSKLGF